LWKDSPAKGKGYYKRRLFGQNARTEVGEDKSGAGTETRYSKLA
jgi:hypothetical protein